MDLRPLFYVIGILLTILAISMSVPLLVDLAEQNSDWKVFLFCQIFTGFFGGILILTNSGYKFDLNIRQAFLLTTMSWLALCVFAAAPFVFANVNMSITDGFFEAMSGLTTTGSTVMTGLDNAPPGILLWRAILQWLGGIGIIVMALSVLPFLKVGGMQLFKTESSENEKALPRTATFASMLAFIYVGLTTLCMFSYKIAGMDSFNASIHAMTTLSTGGFSSSDLSFAQFDNPLLEIYAMIFMIFAALPFIVYIKTVRGDLFAIFKDAQVKAYITIITISIIIVYVSIITVPSIDSLASFRKICFNIISIGSGTGYANADYNLWGSATATIILLLSVLGGCAGSASCGLKIFRLQVLLSHSKAQIKRLLHPHGVFITSYNKKNVSKDIIASVTNFFFIYLLTLALLTIALNITGLDFITSASGAITTLGNVGPGLGEIIGPTGTFQSLPNSSKWIMCIGMFLGRLELFTVLVLFLPSFWRK